MSGSCEYTRTPLGSIRKIKSLQQLDDSQLLNQISSAHVFNQLLIAAETKLFFRNKRQYILNKHVENVGYWNL
jgi:hypothetical protein